MSPLGLKKAISGILALLFVGASTNAWSQTSSSKSISRLDGEIESLRLKQHSLKRLLAEGQSEQEVLRRRVIARGRAYYRLARGVPSGDFFEHAVRVERLRKGIIRDLESMKSLSESRAQAGEGLKEISERSLPLEKERRVTGRVYDALLSQTERDVAFRRAFGKGKSKEHTAIYAPDRPATGGLEAFAKLRGRLPFPLAGRAEVREVVGSDGYHLLAFASVVNASVRTVAAGRVLEIGRSKSGKQFVVIGHGSGYSSLTGGLHDLVVSIGDDLPSHARLGTLAASIQSVPHELTIELRKNGKVLPLADWFGI